MNYISLINLKYIKMIYQLKRELFINTSIDNIWDFASNPHNLSKITPTYMSFKIKTPNMNQTIYPGMIIEYTVSPVLKIPMNWVTEITQVKEKSIFIDEQRFGPYKMWHHEHQFIQKDNGVIMRDIVSYIPPFGFIGNIANKLFIRRQLKEIFDYREKVMNQMFNQ